MSSKTFIVTLMALSLIVTATIGVGAQVGRINPPDPPEEVRRAIEEKARQLDLGAAKYRIYEQVSITGVRGWSQSFERAILYYVPGHGVLMLSYDLNNRAYNRVMSTPSNPQPLGLPISNEFRCLTPNPRDRYQLFERGIIFWRAAEDRYVIDRDLLRLTSPGNCTGSRPPVATVVTAPEGRRHRYRVSIIGFTVNRQTNDDPMQSDGKGDELYIVSLVGRFQSNGELISHTLERGVLMGDTNQRPGNEERQTVGNLSDDGGIGDGYTYMPAPNRQGRYSKPALPWVVYEGELTTGFDALMVIPFIWEWDGDDRQYTNFRDTYFGPTGRPAFFYGARLRRDWVTRLVSESVSAPNGISPNSAFGQSPVLTVPPARLTVFPEGDRPIGLDEDGSNPRAFVPKVLFLTDQLAQRAVATNFPLPAVSSSSGNTGMTVEQFGRLGPGVIPIRYRGTDEGTGDYTLFLKVEQLP
jgi:hypothetical protein